MTRKHLIISINIVLCSAFFVLGLLIAAHVHAQVPSLPYQIYGKVLSQDGIPVQNAKISAFIDGNLVATSETNAQGEYGVAPQTLIIPDALSHFSGKTIKFSVNNVNTQQIAQFQSGTLEQLNIIVSSAFVGESASGQQKAPNSLAEISTTTASTSLSKDENEIISYTTPIFHIKKRKRLSEYTPAHAPIYPHSKILGVIAGFIVLVVFFWVYLQNYLHTKSQNL